MHLEPHLGGDSVQADTCPHGAGDDCPLNQTASRCRGSEKLTSDCYLRLESSKCMAESCESRSQKGRTRVSYSETTICGLILPTRRSGVNSTFAVSFRESVSGLLSINLPHPSVLAVSSSILLRA